MNVLPLCAFVCAINISAQRQSGITDRMGFPNVVSKYHEIVSLNNWRLHMYSFEPLLNMQNVLTPKWHLHVASFVPKTSCTKIDDNHFESILIS